MIATKKLLSVLFTGAIVASATAADYYVALDGTYDGAPDGATVYTTIDQAITEAENAADVIHVEPGMYTISTQYGPNLKAKLVGAGSARGDVTIQSSESSRTLRMAADSWLENVTVVGNTDITKVDKGGAIEMSGGTVTNCVVRDGTAKGTDDNKNAGGNIYSSSTASLIVDCVISGGRAQNRGGNVCLDHGTLRNCTITGGSTSGGAGDNNGGNVWTYQGKIENCAISGGSAATSMFTTRSHLSRAGRFQAALRRSTVAMSICGPERFRKPRFRAAQWQRFQAATTAAETSMPMAMRSCPNASSSVARHIVAVATSTPSAGRRFRTAR